MISSILSILDVYNSLFPDEDLSDLRSLLLVNGDQILNKKYTNKGHITVSAVVLNPIKSILLVNHGKIQRWLPPGGHIEDTDLSLPDAIYRELHEEIGLTKKDLIPLNKNTNENIIPIDINQHNILEPVKHVHYDFRYIFRTESNNILLNKDELRDYVWCTVDDFNHLLPNEGQLTKKIRTISL